MSATLVEPTVEVADLKRQVGCVRESGMKCSESCRRNGVRQAAGERAERKQGDEKRDNFRMFASLRGRATVEEKTSDRPTFVSVLMLHECHACA